MDQKSALLAKPLIVKKGALRILNRSLKNQNGFPSENLCKVDVLYDTTDKYFLKGEYQRLLLVNKFNLISRQNRAVAKYFTNDGTVIEKTSDRVTEVIGHDQYRTIFTALCSTLDQELKIRSILALLTSKSDEKTVTVPSDSKTSSDRKNDGDKPIKVFVENSCQTDEIRVEKLKPKKRLRKPISPYIIQDVNAETNETNLGKKHASIVNTKLTGGKVTRRVLVKVTPHIEDTLTKKTQMPVTLLEKETRQALSSPKTDQTLPILTGDKDSSTNLANSNSTATLTDLDFKESNSIKENSTGLTDLGFLHDEYSNGSSVNLSVLSDTPTNPELFTNPTSFLNNIDDHTKARPLYMVPGTDILVPFKPEDMFHLATKDNLQHSDLATRKKLLKHQLSIDMKHCLTIMDECGNLPIHLAVRNNDLELLVRQCIVLKLQGYTVDVDDDGPTPLKLAIESGNDQLVACLLRHGACPLRTDDEHRACTHDAAEKNADVLSAVLTVCKENARKILYENEDLWKPEMESQTDDELAKYLLDYMCSMFNKQGYNPLMLASSLGLYENVRVLLEHSSNVNDQMPTCGNTALYLATAAACNSSIELGNKSKVVDHFRRTIQILLLNGAKPNIENNFGSNVHTLLQEANNQELSQLVANRQYLELPDNDNKTIPIETDIAKVMLVLGREGDIQYKTLENERNKKKPAFKTENERNIKPAVQIIKGKDKKQILVLDKEDIRYKALESEMNKKKYREIENANKKPVIIEHLVLKPNATSVNLKPEDTSVVLKLEGTSAEKSIDKPNKTLKVVPTKRGTKDDEKAKSTAVKRKQSAVANVMKQAKIDT